jgi:lipopolysaccharide export system protein LptA
MRTLALAFLLAALAPAASAEKADREKEIQVLADRLSADDTKR